MHSNALKNIQKDLAELNRRESEIHRKLSQWAQNSRSGAWESCLPKGGSTIVKLDRLHEELRQIGIQRRFLQQALQDGRLELHKLQAHLSRLACKEMRPQYIAAIKRTLAGIRKICEGNGDLKGIRDEIERLDYRSGALPSAVFEIGERNDPYGGKVASHRKYLSEAFPETRT